MKIINLTPHPINILDGDNNTILTLPKCENPPRLEERRAYLGTIEGIPFYEKTFITTSSLGELEEDVYYVVSLPIAQAYPTYYDNLLVPDELVRDEQGRIIGCRALAMVKN